MIFVSIVEYSILRHGLRARGADLLALSEQVDSASKKDRLSTLPLLLLLLRIPLLSFLLHHLRSSSRDSLH